MPATFVTTETFTIGQQNVNHINLNNIVSGLSVTNIGSAEAELADDGVKARHLNSNCAGSGLEQDSDGALQLLGAGYRALALSNSNVTLTRSTDKRNQEFSGALSGAVIINASRSSAVAGDQFDIYLNEVVTTASNTLTIRENGSGSLVVFQNAKKLIGSVILKFNGTSWYPFLISVTEI